MDDPSKTGWWRASDGQLYPPELHPSARPTAPTPTPPSAPPPGAPPPGAPPPGSGGWSPTPPSSYPPYQAGPGAGPASSTPGLAIAALVLGIGALLFSFIPVAGFFSVPFALAAIGLGIAAFLKSREGQGGRGMAIAGIATGAAALVVSVIWVIALVAFADDVENDLDDINSDPSDGQCNEDRILQDPDC